MQEEEEEESGPIRIGIHPHRHLSLDLLDQGPLHELFFCEHAGGLDVRDEKATRGLNIYHRQNA